ncbi:hypothetical protein MATL_G00057540 [Megalops atlanticus]|uniref:P2X purinoceptor n=1 Tax=Megalops atlanticus TaxID=7932 RepID=A0A9D3Q7A7_MEGAT|nr:hypothetical protein MATL_G00057540 [Megalops atlanticus]
MARGNGCCSSFCKCFFEYETPRVLVIQNKCVGTINRLIQASIVSYVIGYVCVIQQGYQDTDSVISSVTTKVKGTALANTSDLGVQVMDVADYIIPPQMENSFFVLTNMIVTPNQTQTTCPELPNPSTICTSDSDCTAGFSNPRGNGIQTGKCVNYSDTIKTCEVVAWCPLEIDTNLPKPALLAEAENFTVLIKNSIRYPKFNFNKRNILPHINSSYLKRCTFDRVTDPHCPIFRLKDIVTEAGEDFQTMAVNGGVMGILIDWSCDLDLSEKRCIPKYSFRRLDNKNPTNNVAPGYNFRFAKYYKDCDDIDTRTLIKAYGICFDVIVFGKAGKFDMVPTLVNIGAALSFLSLVNAVCDWVVLTFLSKRDYYSKLKFIHVDENEDTLSEGTMYGTQ